MKCFVLLSYCHSQSNVVGGSKTGDISWYSVSWYRFSHECSVKMGTVVPADLFDEEKWYIIAYENFAKYMKWQMTV